MWVGCLYPDQYMQHPTAIIPKLDRNGKEKMLMHNVIHHYEELYPDDQYSEYVHLGGLYRDGTQAMGAISQTVSNCL